MGAGRAGERALLASSQVVLALQTHGHSAARGLPSKGLVPLTKVKSREPQDAVRDRLMGWPLGV